jgi:hypothetical protein
MPLKATARLSMPLNDRGISDYYITKPESVLCCPACAKFSWNNIHSIMNPFLHWKEKKKKGLQ